MVKNAAKYVVIKQALGRARVLEAWEYEVRLDARNEADRRNRTSRKYEFTVVPLKVGKVQRVSE